MKLKILLYARGDRELEKRLHERFSCYRLKGEWFRLDGRLKDFVMAQQRFVKNRRRRVNKIGRIKTQQYVDALQVKANENQIRKIEKLISFSAGIENARGINWYLARAMQLHRNGVLSTIGASNAIDRVTYALEKHGFTGFTATLDH